jgi:hypothetical protein
MLLGGLGGLYYSFSFMGIYGIVLIPSGTKQDIKLLLNPIFGITFFTI